MIPAREERKGPSPLTGIFLTVFIDLLSFGMFIPDLQLRGEALAGGLLGLPRSGWETDPRVAAYIGGLIGGFSLAQLIASPYLGRLSDRRGRRFVLLITCALVVVGHVMYAHADTYWVALVARIVAGIAAANLGVAFAYIADVTPPQDRAKGLGKIGAAFGLGFTIGPPLGGWILSRSGDSPLLLGYVGAGLGLANLLYVWFLLPESRVPDPDAPPRASFLAEVRLAVTTPALRLLIAMFFVYNLAFVMLQSTYFRLLADDRGIFNLADDLAKRDGSLILGFVGLTTAIMQGAVMPVLNRRFEERTLLRIGFALLIPGLALVPFVPLWGGALCVVALQGIGNGLASPSISSLVSRNAPREIQGGIFGITQSLGAFARFAGPFLSNPAFAVRPWAPFVLGGAMVAFPAVAAWFLRRPSEPSVPATG